MLSAPEHDVAGNGRLVTDHPQHVAVDAEVLAIDGGLRGDSHRAVVEHRDRTASPVADRVLSEWDALIARGAFVKVMPHDYKRALADQEIERDDHPVSTGGGGFFTTESEEAA